MQYICAKRSVKPKIAMKLLEEFRRHSIRFVKGERNSKGQFIWYDIGEQRAYEKVCQSLREGAPQLRRQMLASQAFQQRQDSDTKNTNKRKAKEITTEEIAVSLPSSTSCHHAGTEEEARDHSPVVKTNNDDYYRKSKSFRNDHCNESYYYHPYSNYNHHYNHYDHHCPPHPTRGEDPFYQEY
jgi:hypothetical protein